MKPNLTRFGKGYFTPQANYRGRRPFTWLEWSTSCFGAATEIPLGARRARLKRTEQSFRGIADRRDLRLLVARGVNQAFLEEIGQLDRLERLHLEYPVTAADLTPLIALPALRFLSIDTPHRVSDFSPLARLPGSAPCSSSMLARWAVWIGLPTPGLSRYSVPKGVFGATNALTA